MDEREQGDHSIYFIVCILYVVILSPYSCEILCLTFLCIYYSIVRKRVQQPMKFRISTDKYCTYCSVKEFTCEVGVAQIPKWVRKLMIC